MRGPRRGAAALEFAMMLPVVLLIISAVLDYSWYLNQATAVVNATREGARMGATVDIPLGADAEAISHTTRALESYGIPCESSGVCTVRAAYGRVASMNALTVSVEAPFQPLFGLVPTPEVLRGELTMALEDQVNPLPT
jgi:hypothetical protein